MPQTISNLAKLIFATNLLLLLTPSIIFSQSYFSQAVIKAEKALERNEIPLVKKALKIDIRPNTISEKIDSLLLGSKYEFAIGNYKTADETINSANKLARQINNSLLLFKVLNWQGYLNIEWLNLEEADELLEEADELAYQTNKEQSLLYKTCQYYQGLLQIAKKKYKVADSIFLKILNTTKIEHPSNALFIKTNYSLGESKLEQELFTQADSILKQTQLITSHNLSTNHYLEFFILNHLGRVYLETERYKDGINTFEEAINLSLKYNIHKTHPIYGNLIMNYGQLLTRMGEYEKAELLLLEAEQIFQSTFDSTPRYAFMLGRLELLYTKLGQEEKRISSIIKQKEIFQQSAQFSDYARVLNNLSTIYVEQQKFQEAETLFTEGLDILKKNNQTHTSLYAALLMNYAALNIDLGKYEKAQNLSEESRTILAKVFSKKHPWYASVINNLAYLYKTTGNYQKAKNYYLETEKIDGETLGKRHPYYVGTTYSLAGIHELTKEIDTAYHYYQSANEGQVNLIYNYYSGFDEAVRLSYLTTIEADFHQFLSFALRHQNAIPFVTKEAQNFNLATKNLALDFSADNQSLANEIEDSSTLKIYQNWLATKKQLAQSYIQSPEEQVAAGTDLAALEEQAELLEKELVRSEAIATSKITEQNRTTFEDFKTTIQADEALIDFLRFPYYLPERKTDSVYYCALINKADFEQPKMVWLGEEKQLKRLLRSNIRLNGGNYVENPRIGQDLYQQIWQPLTPYLEGVNKIGIAASGLLHKVSFAALPVDNQQLLDHYNFTYYGNLRTYGQSATSNNSQQSISLFGGANFNLDSIQLTQIAAQFQQNSPIINTPPSSSVTDIQDTKDTSSIRSAVTFNYLKGTQKEVENIAQQFQLKDWQAQTFVNNTALEENFKALTGQKAPAVLHIATHGYFYAPLKEGRKAPDNGRGRIMSAQNPLLRSGLALSGANYTWKLGKHIPNLEDGILTAYEIANQNLGNTNLVVLSACETGLGDVVNGEGVFGLQRAFKMAGVKNMLISLWKVPDQQTQELMTTFYQFYLQSNDASDALYQAQLAMSKKYRPFYWAGFILAK